MRRNLPCQSLDKTNQIEQGPETEKFSEEVRKEKRKRNHHEQRKKPSPATIRANAAVVTGRKD